MEEKLERTKICSECKYSKAYRNVSDSLNVVEFDYIEDGDFTYYCKKFAIEKINIINGETFFVGMRKCHKERKIHFFGNHCGIDGKFYEEESKI